MTEPAFDKLHSELRRGALVLAVLAQLREEHYGYSLRKALAHVGIQVEEGTLYPLIRRLEKQGLLHSEWREEAKRKKRFYSLSLEGNRALEVLQSEWTALNGSISKLLSETARNALRTQTPTTGDQEWNSSTAT